MNFVKAIKCLFLINLNASVYTIAILICHNGNTLYRGSESKKWKEMDKIMGGTVGHNFIVIIIRATMWLTRMEV